MTTMEKICMYREKKNVIEAIDKAFQIPTDSDVRSISYEVYKKDIPEHNITSWVEFIVVTFAGGGKSVKVVSGNSNNANFQVIGQLLNGYYEDLGYYTTVIKNYELVSL